ncbi:hypothetical protein EB809_09305 [Marinobacter sp. R17]|uniref:TnsA endonuclease N-terminal domain-containing protein n=1 Tax=Marinobacter sp. R17 TaxID=2484250 RepID=UPI000F4C7E97|nr:TnsA endonuclease N-terminal domain-containing protein [Marinobacter sp. R17]ROT99907.1 hypothetical protein EB809_09305 [Marinobacter sp. R17]
MRSVKRTPPKVSVATLEPRQQPTRRSFRIAVNLYVQWMLKHPHRSEFHSRAEYLYAGLLEGTPAVTAFVPQPFRLRIGRRSYTPDFYVVHHGQPRVVELKPADEVDRSLVEPAEAFLAANGIDFEVVDNSSVFARVMEAENWLEIVRVLHACRHVPTESLEPQLLDEFRGQPFLQLDDVIDPGDRDASMDREIALFRLLHRGQLQADFADKPLDFTTQVWLP